MAELLDSILPGSDEVILTALEFDPFRRYRNAAEFATALAGITQCE